MPKYNFKCSACKNKLIKVMNISDFRRTKDEKVKCSTCQEGFLLLEIKNISVTIDRSAAEIVEEIQQEVRETLNKVYSGDEKTLSDIYGEKSNPYKHDPTLGEE